jgi:hypothetical protein
MSNRVPHRLVACLATDGNGDPNIAGTPLVLTAKLPMLPQFVVPTVGTATNPDGAFTATDANGVVTQLASDGVTVTGAYQSPTYDPNFAQYVYQIPSQPDATDRHVPIFTVFTLRPYTSGAVVGKLAVVQVSYWSTGSPTVEAQNLLATLEAQNLIALVSPTVLTANEQLVLGALQ